MSVSGSRAAVEIDLEEFERRLRAAGTQTAGVEDPLAELARLVEASRPKATSGASAPPAAHPAPPVVASAPRVVATPPNSPPPAPSPSAAIEAGELRPAFEDATDLEPEIAEAPKEPHDPDLEPYPESLQVPPPPPGRRRPRRWLMTVLALAVAGVAMIGAVFALKGVVPGLPKAPPFIAAAQGPTKVQPPSDETVATSNDSGANLLKDNTQANKVKVVNSEEQPVDLNAQTAKSPPAAAPAPSGATDSSGGPVVRGTVDTPVVVASPQPTPAAPSPFPEAKPVRTVSLRPDGTPIPGSAADAGASQTPPSQPAPEPKPQPKPKLAAKPTADAANAQASTPKIDLPIKLPGKTSARVIVAKTDTTAPGGASEAPGEPVQLGAAPAKQGKVKTQAAAVEPAAPTAGAVTEPAGANPGGWAVQLAAPRSEAEAKSVVTKLNQKYASALGGSTLGVHKATVDGDTVYRVRVTGLSKADAAALCARIKGDGGQCFVAK